MNYIFDFIIGGMGLFLSYYLLLRGLERIDDFIALRRKELEYKKNKDLTESIHIQESEDLMSKLITTYLSIWSLENVIDEDSSYIKDAQVNEILEYIISNIIHNMTPTIKAKLAIYYRMDNNTNIIESIRRVAEIHVMEFVIKQNSINFEDNKNPNTTIKL